MTLSQFLLLVSAPRRTAAGYLATGASWLPRLYAAAYKVMTGGVGETVAELMDSSYLLEPVVRPLTMYFSIRK